MYHNVKFANRAIIALKVVFLSTFAPKVTIVPKKYILSLVLRRHTILTKLNHQY
jgi:hypothetical protein